MRMGVANLQQDSGPELRDRANARRKRFNSGGIRGWFYALSPGDLSVLPADQFGHNRRL
jgi:hypothetical protein